MEPYEIRRPTERQGRGRLQVYRAIDAQHSQPLRQLPQRWVAKQPAYQTLSRTPTPELAAQLQQRGVPNVPKAWAELAYEAVRRRIMPTANSRLESLYAYLDPLEALAFTEITGEGKQVWRGDVEDGVQWDIVDVSQFSVPHPPPPNAAGFREAWAEAAGRAQLYWNNPGEISGGEVLVAGPIVLTEQLLLIPFLRRMGLVR